MEKPNIALMYLEHQYKDDSTTEQFYRIKATELISNMSHMYTNQLLGAIGILENYVNCSLELAVSLIRDAVEDYFFGCVEPEWASMEAYEWWENITNNVKKVPTLNYRNKERTEIEWIKYPPTELFLIN